MIGKSGTGASFRGLANYLENDEKMVFRESKNLPGFNRNQDIRLLENTASLSRAENPVYHISISYSPRDNPTDEMMIEDMNQVLEELGLEDHQAVLVGHDDHEYKHIHGMVNRVCPGKDRAFNPWQDRPKIIQVLKDIELDRGYEKVSAKEIGKARVQAEKGEFHYGRRIGKKSIPERGDIRAMFDQSSSWKQLKDELAKIGCEVKPKGRGGVISDPLTGQQMKLSRVGRQYSWGKLNERFGSFKEHDKARQRAKNAEKIIGKHIDNEKIQQAFGKAARAQFKSKKAASKAANGLKKTMQQTLKRGYQVRGAIRGFTALTSAANPIGKIARIGLKFAQGINKELEQDRGLGR